MIEKGYTVKVLDKGFVRVIDWLGDDKRIVETARISYKSPSKGEEQDKKLLRYLWQRRHTSPFEQCSVTLNIKIPLFVHAQLKRHRTFRLNEQSARYSEMSPEFYIPAPNQWRGQDTNNKQGSVLLDHEPQIVVSKPDYHMGEDGATSTTQYLCDLMYENYQAFLRAGVSREMARMILPVNLYTEIYINCDIHNLLHFLTLRMDSHAQWEIQQYANVMYDITKALFPVTIDAFDNFKWSLKLN